MRITITQIPAAWRRLAVVSALALLAWPARGQYDPDWTRNFRVGGLMGFNIKTDFKMSGTFSLGGPGPGATGDVRDNHFFDDGYVRIDDTGNAPALGAHWTTFWGYENAPQLSGNTLTMHSTDSFTTTGAGINESVDDSPYLGFELAYGGCIRQWTRTRLGWEFGFGWLPINVSTGNRTLNANVEQSTYTFDTGGVILPTAPYHGGPSGFGQPSIQDVATLLATTSSTGTISGSMELDVNLFAFRLGPTFFWDISPQFGLSLSAGPAIGIVEGNLVFNETIQTDTTVKNNGRSGSTEIVYGGYVNATLTYHAVANGDFYFTAQYMPLGSATFGSGGRQAKLNLNGAVFIAGGVNWPF